MPTSRPAIPTSSRPAMSSVSKCAATIEPKIWLIDATLGVVTCITWKWRLARLGMSFLPPPGVSMQPMKARSTIDFHSPGLSRLYTPWYSMSCRTSSSVGWSPHVLTSGDDRSSMKKTIRFDPGGPNVRPDRFSTLASIVCWSILGVVADESDTVFVSTSVGFCFASTCSTLHVLAVPGLPTSSTGRPRASESSSMCWLRTLSIVGTRIDVNDAPRSCPLCCHLGTHAAQCSHSHVASLIRYS